MQPATIAFTGSGPSAAPPISAPARSFRSARNIATTQANGRNIPNDGSGQPRPQDSPMNMNRKKPAVSTPARSFRSARNIATTQANGRNIPNDGSGQPRPQDSPMNMNRKKPAVST